MTAGLSTMHPANVLSVIELSGTGCDLRIRQIVFVGARFVFIIGMSDDDLDHFCMSLFSRLMSPWWMCTCCGGTASGSGAE